MGAVSRCQVPLEYSRHQAEILSKKTLAGLYLTAAALVACGPQDDGASRGADAEARAVFTDIASEVGLTVPHEPAVDSTYYMPESLGSGGGFLDYDNDGDLDIYLVNGAWREAGARRVENRLFRQGPDGAFTDVTESSGLGDTGYGMGVAVGDIDNDGDVDVYVTNVEADALYRNESDGSFTNITSTAGIDNRSWGASAAFFDFDLDGFLDLYVTNYVRLDPSGACMDEAGRSEYCGPMAYPGVADVLYHNMGDGTFEDVSLAAGIAAGVSRGLGVVSADFDGNGLPDIYVANDSEPNHLWLNQGGGVFRDEAQRLGASVNELGRPEAGMGIALGDADGDGALDMYLTHLARESNTLYRNIGPAGFLDATARAGLHGPSLPYTGFGTAFLDYDHDGDIDLAVANGRVNRGSMLARRDGRPSWWDPYSEPNSFYANQGDGTFRDVTDDLLAVSESIEVSRGLAVGDVDDDGDLDILIVNAGGNPRLLRNDSSDGHWVLIRVVDPELQRDAIGADLTLWAGGIARRAIVGPAYSYLSTNDPRVHFGLGEETAIDSLRILWPGGAATIHQVDIDRSVTIQKSESTTGR